MRRSLFPVLVLLLSLSNFFMLWGSYSTKVSYYSDEPPIKARGS